MNEIKFHGRGGQGAVTSSKLLARAATNETGGFGSLSPWHRDARIQKCVVCGRPIAPVAQLDVFARSTGIPRSKLNICVDCRSTTVRGADVHDTAVPTKTQSDSESTTTHSTEVSF